MTLVAYNWMSHDPGSLRLDVVLWNNQTCCQVFCLQEQDLSMQDHDLSMQDQDLGMQDLEIQDQDLY